MFNARIQKKRRVPETSTLQEIEDFSNGISNMIGFLCKMTTTNLSLIRQNENEYKELKSQLSAYFAKLGLTDPNPFPTLERFAGFTSAQYQHWAERRTYIKGMYGQTLQTLTLALKHAPSGESIKIIANGASMVCKPIFKSRNFKIQKTCFVLIPFRPSFERLYNDYIKPAMVKRGFEVIKANELFTTTPIIEDIWEQINDCQVIVADVTGKNPNVFYELGIAHTVGKTAIILSQNDEDVPFDLRHLRYFKYDDNDQGWKKLSECLEKIPI